MSIDINLVNKLGKNSGGNKNSVKNKKKTMDLMKGANSLGKNVSKGVGSVQSGFGVDALGLLAKGGSIGVMLGTTLTIASKSVDLRVNYQTAKTGQTLYYGNIKAGKDMIESLGFNYISGLIRNELFTKNLIKRQNSVLDYGKDLYNLNNLGEKYKAR